MAVVIVFDPSERDSGIPQRLSALGLPVREEVLGDASYLVGERVAVRRAEEHELIHWLRARPVLAAVQRLREDRPNVVLLAEGAVSRRLAELRHGALARAIVLGVTVLPVADAEEAARWLGRLAVESERARPRLVAA